jgi:hypothetical protein
MLDPTQLQLRVIALDQILLHQAHAVGRVERMTHLLEMEPTIIFDE